MNTLVVHPFDTTTDFLNPIYINIPNCKVITGGITKGELRKIVEMAEEVIMCGHGSPSGLFAIGQFKDLGYADYIIDSSFASLLKQKKVVAIWCYAKSFIDSYQIKKAFYSDMFISEVTESIYCGLTSVSQAQVDESNYCFSNSLSTLVHLNPGEIYAKMMDSAYAELANINPIAAYNYPRLGTNVNALNLQFS